MCKELKLIFLVICFQFLIISVLCPVSCFGTMFSFLKEKDLINHFCFQIHVINHRVLGEDITLEISNMNKNLIFISGLVIKFIPYIHFCPKMALPSNNFLKDCKYSLKTANDRNCQLNKMLFRSAIFGQKWI